MRRFTYGLTALGPLAAWAGEEKVDLDKVPKAVLATYTPRLPPGAVTSRPTPSAP